MSTPNFEFMKYNMPLIIADMDYYDLKEQYEEEFDEEFTEEMFYDEMDFRADDMVCLANEFNKTLKYHTVEVKDGYYADMQFVVYEKYENDFDLSKDSPYCIDNEDAHSYFDMCRSKVLRQADAEKRRIYKWLKSLKDQGYTELVCDGVFSNGEAVYSRV